MTYFDFLNEVIYNYNVSQLIDSIKIEYDEELENYKVVAIEANKSLIIVADFKQAPDIEMPEVQGISQMAYLSKILNIAEAGDKKTVKFKTKDDGTAHETTFTIDNATIKIRNVPKTILPDTPKNLKQYNPNVTIDLDSDTISHILKLLSIPMKNAHIYFSRSKNDKLLLVFTNTVDTLDIELDLDLEDGILDDENFKIDGDKFKEILKISNSNGCTLSFSTDQKLCSLVKEDDNAVYNYFLVKMV